MLSLRDINPFRRRTMQEFNEYLRARCYGEAGMYTPDINELETHKRQLIFVMDDMMTGGKYHDYITETNLFGRWPGCSGYTEDEYTFLQRRLEDDAYGVVLSANYADDAPAWAERTRHGKPVTKAKIWGQVYSIRPFQFIKLDFLKENGVQFIRKRVNITIPIQKAFLKPLPEVSHEIPYSLECWMYTGLDEYFKDLIDNGFMFTPVTTVEYKGVRDRPWLKRYYLYRNVQKQYNY